MAKVTDILLLRRDASILVASMYCDVARLLVFSLAIKSFIMFPFPCVETEAAA